MRRPNLSKQTRKAAVPNSRKQKAVLQWFNDHPAKNQIITSILKGKNRGA